MCVSILRTTECGLEYVYYHEKEMGRQYIRMEGVGIGEALRKAEDREGRRKVIARSPLMTQQSFRLRDE